MLKKFHSFIEHDPWDELIKRNVMWLDRACWLAIALAAIYFSPVLWHIFTR